MLNCLLLVCVCGCMLVVQNDIQGMEKLSCMGISLHEKSHQKQIKKRIAENAEAQPLSRLEYAGGKGRAGQEKGSDRCGTAEAGRWRG